MASKFGGDQAAKNQWVMQQNLARHKSVQGYVHKGKQPKPKVAPAKPAEAVEVAAETPTPPTT